MENTSKEQQIISKKLSEWNSPENNFISEGEITVIITLEEYRELIKFKATKEYEMLLEVKGKQNG